VTYDFQEEGAHSIVTCAAVNAVSHRLFEKADQAVSEDRELFDVAKYDMDVCARHGWAELRRGCGGV